MEEIIEEDRKWCVYMHTFPNNKAYIGITCRSPEDRYGPNGCKYQKEHQSAMYNAIQKYKWENVQHYVFAENLTITEANHMEMLLIALFKTNRNRYSNPSYGYNLTDGGDGTKGRKFTDEQRKRQSEMMKERLSDPTNHPMFGKHMKDESKEKNRQSHLGKKASEETRKKISAAHLGEKNHNYGRKRTDEEKRIQSEAMKGRYCGDKNPNYGNHKLAGENHPNYGKPMSEEQKIKLSIAAQGKYVGAKNPRAKPVVQLAEDLKLIKYWSYITEASNELHISRTSIAKCCEHKQKTAGGFKWLYKWEYENLLKENINN